MGGNDQGSSAGKGLTRREVLRLLGGTAGACMLSAGIPGLTNAQAATRPNIIFILCDDHRWDHLSSMGHPFLKTANLDRMYTGGVLCENAFVTTSLCSPSRASFLTGQYAHKHGVKNNITPWNNDNVTFLEILKQHGYDTAFIGKWHMPGKGLPTLRGVDRFISFTAQRGQGQYYNCPLFVDGVETPSRREYITQELTDYALEFIGRKRDNPFCVYLSLKAVHHQWLPPRDLKGIYKDVKDLGLPQEADNWLGLVNNNITYGTLGRLDDMYRRYCETIVSVDREVGRVLESLDTLGISQDTAVIFVGDNGFFWGEHRLVDKRWAYEESIRVPLLVRYPRLIKNPGRKVQEMVLNIDLAPTVLDIAGITPPEHIQGRSIVPLLEASPVSWRTSWLYEYYRDYPYTVPDLFAVRTDTYKYIETGSNHYPPELYNIRHDSKEMHNLYHEDKAAPILTRMQAELERLKRETGMEKP
ncbi:MAG TPA: sulfatase [Deltaproteobacteria bacterium]|nr:sulfatase [Deltaproteobacteria bacterium]